MDPTEQADTTPPAGETPATPSAQVATASADPTTTTEQAETITAAEARELRREAQSLRRRLREIEGQQSTTATEAQQQIATLQAELDALRAQHSAASETLRSYRLRDAIAETARASDDLRGLDPDLAARLVEGVEWGDDGKPKGLTAALKSLIERYPQIAGPAQQRSLAQPPAGGRGGQARAALDADLIEQKRRQIGAI